MLSFLPVPLRGSIAILLYALNILFWPWVIFLTAAARLIPIPIWQKACAHFLHKIPFYWTTINNLILRLTTKIEWDIRGLEKLSPTDWYLLICNHQSWADIIVLGWVLNHHIPTLKFFIKKELLWSLFIAGWAAFLLDFPVMHRHTKEYLAKHPEQKGRDIATTRKACEKFKTIPTSVISFIEGTRFTPEKHARQASPYRYLLRPRAGGIAFALAIMGSYFQHIINVTIVYPSPKITAWQFFSGQIKKIVVAIEVLPITPNLLGDYENNREFRVLFQSWINNLWQTKDELIHNIRNNL